MIEADQVFVKSSSRDAVIASLNDAVQSRGLEIRFEQLPLPDRYTTPDRKTTRHFYVSQPVNGWVCVLESKGGDAELARQLSTMLNTKAVWLSFSHRAGQVSYTVISAGDVVKDETIQERKKQRSWFGQARDNLVEQGQQVYQREGLPWPFYSYEQVDHSPNKDEYFVHVNFGRGRST